MNEVTRHTIGTSQNERIAEYQRRVRELPAIYCVWIECDDEHSLEGLYDTEQVAREVCHRINAKPRYYGRAYWNTQRVLTRELLSLLYPEAQSDEQQLTSGSQS
jgi:hypothetical protein